MSIERAAALLVGFALLMTVPTSWPAAIPALILVSYGLLPRKGVRVSSKLAKTVYKALGLPLLALTLLVVSCAVTDKPSVLPFLLCIFLIPSLALTLYGFEVGVVPRFSAKTVAYARALVAALSISALGLAMTAAYAEMALSDPKFLWELHEVSVPAVPRPREALVPGWLLFCIGLGFGFFLAVPGFIALARLRRLARALEGAPRPSWAPNWEKKAAQALILAVSALMIGTGPVVHAQSGKLLPALLIPAFGVHLMLVAVDPQALAATYRELKAALGSHRAAAQAPHGDEST